MTGIERRADILDTIEGFWAEHGFAPTVREVAADIGLSVTETHRHLTVLRRQGDVTWVERRPRTLRAAVR